MVSPFIAAHSSTAISTADKRVGVSAVVASCGRFRCRLRAAAGSSFLTRIFLIRRPSTERTRSRSPSDCTSSPASRYLAQLVVDEAAHGVEVLALDVQAQQLVEVVDADARVDDDLRVVHLLDGRLLAVVLVLDLADDLLQHVLDGHDARRAAVLVDDDGHVDAVRPHVGQQLVDVLRLRHEERRTRQLAQVRLRAVDVAGRQVAS